MSFLFFIMFTWYDISNINMFPIYLSITTKEDGGDKVRSYTKQFGFYRLNFGQEVTTHAFGFKYSPNSESRDC